MRIKGTLLFVVSLPISLWPPALAGERPKADNRAEINAEAKAKADYASAERAARDAEGAVAPLKAAMQQADTAYANASKTANMKRQQATDAKNLAGPPGIQELKQAKANLPVAINARVFNPSYQPPAERIRPSIRDEDRPKGVQPTLPKSSVDWYLRQIETLYQDWFLTDEFANREIAEIEARLIK